MRRKTSIAWLGMAVMVIFSVKDAGAQAIDSSKYITLKSGILKDRFPKYMSSLKEWGNKAKAPVKVFTLREESHHGVTSYSVSAILTRVDLEKSIPSYYTILNGNVILIYSGLEDISNADLKFLNYLKKMIGNDLYNSRDAYDYSQSKSDSVSLIGVDGKRKKVSRSALGQDIDFNVPQTYLHPPVYELVIDDEFIIEKEICSYNKTPVEGKSLLK